jgi:2-polyprenyl-6-hydroxyphenyl methylase/3-demethylubiquinone-9 3-methyltransferase
MTAIFVPHFTLFLNYRAKSAPALIRIQTSNAGVQKSGIDDCCTFRGCVPESVLFAKSGTVCGVLCIRIMTGRGTRRWSMADGSKTVQSRSRAGQQADLQAVDWDHSSHDSFYRYYAEESASPKARERFIRVRDAVLRILQRRRPVNGPLQVADIGCGAGAQSAVWAESGHTVHALDINGPLLELGRRRAAAAGYTIDFRLGSATALPWADESMDVCIALELLEHVADWKSCIREFTRIVRPGGALLFTTTNRLCPVQSEFNLPLYSWYPAPVKRHYEKLALTTRPEIANFARYPAVNWFTFYGFRQLLKDAGFDSLDRFDIMDVESKGPAARAIVASVRTAPVLRWLAHVCTPSTIVLAIKAG